MDKIYQKTPSGAKRAGFTLIELLAVVLIIGLLAAAALPQYQAAVDKARITQYIALGAAIKSAQEAYFMANGEYCADLRNLDVSMPGGCVFLPGTGMWNEISCGNDFLINNVASAFKSYAELYVYYCPGRVDTFSNCLTKGWGLIFYYDNHAQYPGKIECRSSGGGTRGQRVCKSLKF